MIQHLLVGQKESYRLRADPKTSITTIIGKNPERKEETQRKLVFPDKTLANSHCAIKTSGTSCLLRPLTRVGIIKRNGKPIPFGTITPIQNGDIIQVGNTQILYKFRQSKIEDNSKATFNHQQYLEELKKNNNYTPSIVNDRK